MTDQLPSKAETLLLYACVRQTPSAIDAWRQWQKEVPFDDIDLGSRRLLPMLHDNLKRLRVEDPILRKYEGLKKLHWFHNRLLMFHLKSVLESFSCARVVPLLIKGSALNVQGLFPPGLRPMTDLDIVVPVGKEMEAIAIVEGIGWKSDNGQDRPINACDIRFCHHSIFAKEPSVVLELHWETASQFIRGVASERIWENSILTDWQGYPCRLLNPSDHLLLILAHGGRHNNIPPIRWATDALAILEHQNIEWEYFTQQADQHRLSFVVGGMLDYLNKQFQANIPNSLVQAIRAIPVKQFDRRVWKDMQRPNHIRGVLSKLDSYWLNLCRFESGKPSLSGGISYVRYMAGLKRNGKGFTGLLASVVKRVRNSFRRSASSPSLSGTPLRDDSTN